MILYDPHIPVSLHEFGILIPIRDSRTTRTISALKSDPMLGAIEKRWHRDHIDETLSRDDVLRVHSPGYVERLFSDKLEEEITSIYELIDPDGHYHRYAPDKATRPLSDLFHRILLKAAGSAQSARLAMETGFCFYFAGGMHHAYADHGSGFCPVNDIVIAARKLQHEQKVRNVWIIDVDAHKGDGTAALTAGDASIRTLSIHMARGWPLDAAPTLPDGSFNPVFTPSDIDIPMESGEEKHYTQRLEQGLQRLKEAGPADLAIVVCGADPYEKDELPSTAGLRLSLSQMLERDRLVYHFLEKQNVPATFLMAGGYGEETWRVYTQFLDWVLKTRYGRRGD